MIDFVNKEAKNRCIDSNYQIKWIHLKKYIVKKFGSNVDLSQIVIYFGTNIDKRFVLQDMPNNSRIADLIPGINTIWSYITPIPLNDRILGGMQNNLYGPTRNQASRIQKRAIKIYCISILSNIQTQIL